MAKIFFSYKRNDPDFETQIEKILSLLKLEGFDVFIDRDGIRTGEVWFLELEKAMDECVVGLVIWTPASCKSKNVNLEAQKLTELSKYCSIMLTSDGIPYIFKPLQGHDLMGWDQSAEHKKWRALITDLRNIQKAHETNTMLLAKRELPDNINETPPKNKSTGKHSSDIDQSITFRDSKQLPLMVKIPTPGRFFMGADAHEPNVRSNQCPATPIHITHPFAISIFPISEADWALAAAVGAKGVKPRNIPEEELPLPVIGVSWLDAKAYVNWLNFQIGARVYRLPSEAEWEYVARAGDRLVSLEKHDIRAEKGRFSLLTYRPNRWGVADMTGNVWEWCEDNYLNTHEEADQYGGARSSPRSNTKTVRGGSWRSPLSDHRATARSGFDRTYSSNDVGFRIARKI